MKTLFTILLTLLLTHAFVSCNNTPPAAFWKSYKKDVLVEVISGQGLYGGHIAMHWKADRANNFTSVEIIDFAAKKGWTFVDSLAYNPEQTSKWQYHNLPVFPLSHEGMRDAAANSSTYEHFPRRFGGQIMVYRFKSGWLAIQPGTDRSMEENGFVLLNNDKSEMAVYHLWGE